jgi:uncharacterized membrane protein YeaQ/YmgE (transglycosylase-associated protein family)
MALIAWMILGLASSLLARQLISGTSTPGLILNCVLGIAGALLGGWAASSLSQTQIPGSFFSLSAWLAAITGAAVFLLAYHAVIGQPRDPRRIPVRVRVPVVIPARRPGKPR